jgi:hypothetical protein
MYGLILGRLKSDLALRDLPWNEYVRRLRSHPEIANKIVRHQLVNPPPPSDREGGHK